MMVAMGAVLFHGYAIALHKEVATTSYACCSAPKGQLAAVTAASNMPVPYMSVADSISSLLRSRESQSCARASIASSQGI